uniref:Uncharacterized protein n=1 Tax=Oryza barthii TaxID=65489 RepID=A0A0D3G9J8_9ORYZ
MRRSRVRPMQRWCHPCMQQPKPWKEAEEVLSGYGSDVEEQWQMADAGGAVADAERNSSGGPRAGSAPAEEVVQAPTIHKGMPHVHKVVQTPLHTNWGKKKRKKEEAAGRRGHEGDDGELDGVDHGVEDPNGTCGEQVEGVDCRGRVGAGGEEGMGAAEQGCGKDDDGGCDDLGNGVLASWEREDGKEGGDEDGNGDGVREEDRKSDWSGMVPILEISSGIQLI